MNSKNTYRVDENFAYIELENSEGFVMAETKINADSLDYVLDAGKWYLEVVNGKSMAFADMREKTSLQSILLICKRSDYMAFHLDGDSLNNTRENLSKQHKSLDGMSDELKKKMTIYEKMRRGEALSNDETPVMNVMSFLSHSYVNGPGDRFTLWTQGCMKACPGCFNPSSWNYKIQNLYYPQEIANKITASGAEGVTFSGGCPLEQSRALYDVLTLLHDENGNLIPEVPLGIISFTGYTVEEIDAMTDENGEYARKCRPMLDLLIDGRFVQALKHEHTLSGSSNQRFWWLEKENRGKDIIDSSRIDETFDQMVEVHLGEEEGIVEITGFPSINPKFLKAMGLKILK